MTVHVRAARASDVEPIRRVERSSGRLFDDIGMHDIAAAEPPPAGAVSAYVGAGRAWVVSEEEHDDAPVAFVLVDVVDGCAHVAQVSVERTSQRKGYGRMLLERVDEWARERGVAALTLTTFRDVPWNAPYYARCGFRVLREDELTPGLRDIREIEAAHGLDPDVRVCMRREVTTSP